MVRYLFVPDLPQCMLSERQDTAKASSSCSRRKVLKYWSPISMQKPVNGESAVSLQGLLIDRS